ncbi:uncharacterized protein PAC_09830 [Phialocephala subalpina]|uniref:Uncharacterized protein n=1 Tax=Phialocephala subalpina TaxID=576137 RepID=A0A1L7X4J1_9HELO|nr:uncharacterized protein PAC_09830 [Phialocephala subalpina]
MAPMKSTGTLVLTASTYLTMLEDIKDKDSPGEIIQQRYSTNSDVMNRPSWKTDDIGYRATSGAIYLKRRVEIQGRELPDYVQRLIIAKDYVNLQHRKESIEANKEGIRKCWLASNDDSGKSGSGNERADVDPPSVRGPCGSCREKIAQGEDIVCLYFVSNKEVSVWR